MTSRQFNSPAGPLHLSAADGRLVRIAFSPPGCDEHTAPARCAGDAEDAEDTGDAAVLARACAQFDEYFAGARRRFDLPIALSGSDFQMRVWSALQRVPYGQTRSYRQIAQAIGRASACRAVGAANGANPLPIVVPCHRVIGADGSLSGFAGGVEVKRMLLDHERARAGLFADAVG